MQEILKEINEQINNLMLIGEMETSYKFGVFTGLQIAKCIIENNMSKSTMGDKIRESNESLAEFVSGVSMADCYGCMAIKEGCFSEVNCKLAWLDYFNQKAGD